MKSLLRSVGTLAAAVAVVVLAPGVANAALRTGTKAPALKVRTIDGKTISLQQLRGKVVLLDFWATWCPPCREEIPGLQALHKKYAKRGLRVLGVSVGDEQGAPAKFAKQNGMTYTVAYTNSAQAATLGKQFDFDGIPCTYIIDKRGVIRYANVGYDSSLEKPMEQTIQKLLKAR